MGLVFFVALLVIKVKILLKQFVNWFPIALTKSEAIDRNTYRIIHQVCEPKSVCVDVGANKGRILQMMINAAPGATHIAYEPLPKMYNLLIRKFASAARIYKIALTDEKGLSPFYHTREDTSYSGFKKRDYPRKFHLEKLEVATDRMDNLIGEDIKVALIKIDVEGAEYKVIKGATETIKRCKPVVIFEFGQGGSDEYDVSPEMMWDYFTKTLSYRIYTLTGFLKKRKSLQKKKFIKIYNNGQIFYFVGTPHVMPNKN